MTLRWAGFRMHLGYMRLRHQVLDPMRIRAVLGKHYRYHQLTRPALL